MKRTPINQKANREIKKQVNKLEISTCELKLKGCQVNWCLGAAHRHKRVWYYDKPDSLLWDRTQWMIGCPNCHETIEHDPDLTHDIFEATYGRETWK